ncbi:MAG TPA: DUF2851 family protein [Sphingobacteriaceae bacterium]
MSFPEDFLHYVWKFRQFKQQQLLTADGTSVEILSAGMHNKNAGPDFENAKVRLGDTVWVGNIEIHLNSSDWQRHGHHTDPAYDSVILHVVFNHDQEQYRKDNTAVPVLELKDVIPEGLYLRYHDLTAGLNWIACQAAVGSVDRLYISNWLSRVLFERLEERSRSVRELVQEYRGNWDDAFYVILARNFGFKVNAVPFEMLARSLPVQLFGRHKDNALQIEALIFGQAGLLDETFGEEYPNRLKSEYLFLKKKYNLQTGEGSVWRYLRLRPQNFPTLRLAQFSALMVKADSLFSKILEARNVASLSELFYRLPVNDYWKNHYRFGVAVKPFSNQIGTNSVNNILINTIALFLFCYGKTMGRNSLVNRAVELLEVLPPESNQTLTRFKEAGIETNNAFSSQALLQLKRSYCDKKRCLECGIGIKVLNR